MSKMKRSGKLDCATLCFIAWLSGACDATNTGGNYGSIAGNATTFGSGGRSAAGGSTSRGGGMSASGGRTTGVGGSATTFEAACAAICANILAKQCSENADYTVDACMTDCEDTQVDFAECPDEFMTWLMCTASQPASSWICDDTGNAALGPGLCDAETSSLATCVSSG